MNLRYLVLYFLLVPAIISSNIPSTHNSTIISNLRLEQQINSTELIQLDQKRIDAHYKKYEHNFKMRGYLKFSSYAAYAGMIGIVLYHTGILHSFLPQNFLHALRIPDANEARFVALEKAQQELLRWQQEVIRQLPAVSKIEVSQARAGIEWLWGGVKSIGNTALISAMLAKLMQYNSYVETKPSFKWFFTNHSITDRLEVFKHDYNKLPRNTLTTSPFYPAVTLIPQLQAISINIEEFVAFMDYYFDQFDQDFIIKKGMHTQSRYVYNLSNDFFKKIHDNLNEQNSLKVTAIIDEFKNDLVDCIKKSQFFEKDISSDE